jgi:glycosyltransferase involved in cell wall biosynthesis
MKTLCIDLRWIDASGVGVYIKGIMPGIVERLSDVSIVGLGNATRIREFPWSRSANVRLIDCKVGRYSIAEQIQLPRVIASETDLFFSPYYTIPLFLRGKIAVTVHDMAHLTLPEIICDRKKYLYAQMMFRAVRKRASTIFTVSDFTKNELLRLTKGRRSDNIISIHLGVAPEWREAAKLPAIRPKPYFICVGNVKPNKNISRLVRAFQNVQHAIPHDLVIVGQKEGMLTGESKEFFDQIRAAGSRVQMTGSVPQADLLALVAHADALIMPSLYEGFGLPPLEAMAAGVPAVVSRAASLPEVCGDAVLYFDPLREDEISSRLLQIAQEPSLRAQLREAGLRQSAHNSWEACSEKTASRLLEDL